MTGEVFQEWILSLERSMKAEKRKILLLTDNCSAHKNVPRHVENIKVVFLPPNCTSILQSLDQGIIHATKVHYKSRLVRRMLANISVGHDVNTNIQKAIQMFSEAWKTLSAAAIVNCFHKAGTVLQDK
jgi:hypothetical protein